MARGGFVGKILYVDLTTGKTDTIATEKYESWGGGHGLGAALFWDLVEDKTIDSFHPDNLVSFTTSPFSGAGVPAASGRTEITGIGSQSYPVEWFTRSNFGGRWSAMLKYAGFDGVAIQGKAEKPVWINIVNGNVTIESAEDLWGLDTHETQEEIWKAVTGNADVRDWLDLSATRDGGRTTQKPAVACIGPAGENQNRNACVVHDAGNAAGQGGFGGVLGAKNLKAISVLGTGSVPVADPAALLRLRVELQQGWGFDPDDPKIKSPHPAVQVFGNISNQPGYGGMSWIANEPSRPQGCQGCFKNCRRVYSSGVANGNICVESLWWAGSGDVTDQMKAMTLIDQVGINAYDLWEGHAYLYSLYKMGILGPGKQIPSELPWDKYNTFEWVEAFLTCIAEGTDIGADLKDGVTRAAVKWGRYEEDTSSGLLNRPQWGYPEHYDPRLEVEWSYGSLFGDRDINEHGINTFAHWGPTIAAILGVDFYMSAEDVTKHFAEASGLDDPTGWDYSEEGIYSDAKIKAVAWHRHYGRFWIQSMLMCDWAWPNALNYAREDGSGATPDFEPKFYTAVTGEELTYEESLERGRKIWNLGRAIWTLQGRTREMEVFSGYVYDVPTKAPYFLPVLKDGEWSFDICLGRTLDREKFEGVKDRFYALEGWDVKTGWPTRAGLEELGMGDVADALESAEKLGA